MGDIFGHVALLYGGHNEPMRATTKTKVCCLSRDVYQKFSAARSTAKLSQNMRLISSIPVFSNLSMKERGKLADACKTRRYNQGDYIITQGQKGTEFFILTAGHATLHRRDTSGRNPIADPIIDRKYKGEWQDGKPHGQGTMSMAGACNDNDGRKYEGEWRDGKEHGKGTMSMADGRKYEGEWHDGKPDGWGTMTMADCLSSGKKVLDT